MGKLAAEKTKEYASDINSGGRKLLVILNDILDMANIDSGGVTLSDDRVNLADVAHNALAAIEEDAPIGKKTVRIEDHSGGMQVRCDESRMRQVISHILSNAVKFTGPEGRIDIAIENLSDGIDLVVRDDGAGISPEMLSLVLEPFGQAESAYARSHGGIGLGLPIVRSLVELHGGTFTLSSEIGAGTTARVHIPASRVVSDVAGLMAKAS